MGMTAELGLENLFGNSNGHEVNTENEREQYSNPVKNLIAPVEINTPLRLMISKNLANNTTASASNSVFKPKIGHRMANGKVLVRASSVLNSEMVTGKSLERWKMVRQMVNNKTLVSVPIFTSLTNSPIPAAMPTVNKWNMVKLKVNEQSVINADQADKWKVIQRVVNQKILVRNPPDSDMPIDKRRVLVRGSSFIDGM